MNAVEDITKRYEDIISALTQARDAASAEGMGGQRRARYYAVAITQAEGACLWAVKAITLEDKAGERSE